MAKLDYEPRRETRREPMGPSDRAGWVIAGIFIFFIAAIILIVLESLHMLTS